MPTRDTSSKFRFDGPGTDPAKTLPKEALDFANTHGTQAREVMTSLKNFKDSRSTGLGDIEWNAFIELAKNGREGKAVIDAIANLQEAKKTDLTLQELQALGTMAAIGGYQTKAMVYYLTCSLRMASSDAGERFIEVRTPVLTALCEKTGGNGRTNGIGISKFTDLQEKSGRVLTVEELVHLETLSSFAGWSFPACVQAYSEIVEKGGELSSESLRDYASKFNRLTSSQCKKVAEVIAAVQAISESPLSPSEQQIAVAFAKGAFEGNGLGQMSLEPALLFAAVNALDKAFRASGARNMEEKVALGLQLEAINRGLECSSDESLVESVTNYLTITAQPRTLDSLAALQQFVGSTDGSYFEPFICYLAEKAKTSDGAVLTPGEFQGFSGSISKLSRLCERIKLHDWYVINEILENLANLESEGCWYLKPGDFDAVAVIVVSNLQSEFAALDIDIEDSVGNAETPVLLKDDLKALQLAKGSGLSSEDWKTVLSLTKELKGDSMLAIRALGYIQLESAGRSVADTVRQCKAGIVDLLSSPAWPDILVVSARAHSQLARKPIEASGVAQASRLARAPNVYPRRAELYDFSARVLSDLPISSYPEWIEAMAEGLEQADKLSCSLEALVISSE
jgi:hypothetical protein